MGTYELGDRYKSSGQVLAWWVCLKLTRYFGPKSVVLRFNLLGTLSFVHVSNRFFRSATIPTSGRAVARSLAEQRRAVLSSVNKNII